MTFYEIILSSFNDNNVEYLIVGGIAVNLHGVDRTTKDLDIWVNNSIENRHRLGMALTKLGYSDKGINEALDHLSKDETIIVPDKLNNHSRIDILGLYSSYLKFSDAYAAKNIINIGSVSTAVISLDDLIESKIRSGRPRDLSDAKNLQDIREKRNKIIP